MAGRDHSASTAQSSKLPEALIDIRVITHNIRYATHHRVQGEEQWQTRCPRLCSQLSFNAAVPATFICLQEALHSQLQDILGLLNGSSGSLKNEWAYIGVGRDDGKQAGEYSPIFYRPAVWDLTRWETRWLSPTSNVPSRGWDAACIRLVTIGDFVHRDTGKKVVVLSTHFDHYGQKSREESSRMILAAIQSLTKFGSASAILLAGDFNSPPNDFAYQIMTSSSSLMEDIALQVPKEKRYGNEMTFTSFGYADNTPSRIDFIFSRKNDKVTFKTYGVLANRFDDGVYLSDHRACVADIILHS